MIRKHALAPVGSAGAAMELRPLAQTEVAEIVALMNSRAVRRHLPLLTGDFTEEDCRAFLDAKQAMWDAHGYGPFAILIDGEFAGWGGLQPEGDDADFALVLRPEFWGWGRRIFSLVKEDAFGRLGLPSITVLLPPGRVRRGALTRLGFVEDGEAMIGRVRFHRFRLPRPANTN